MLLRYDLPNPNRAASLMVRSPVPFAEDLAVESDGTLHLLASGVIYRYSASGTSGGTRSTSGPTRRLAVGDDGTLYTAGSGAGGRQIVRYPPGAGEGVAFGPADVDAVDLDVLENGDLAVCDLAAGRVRVLSPSGSERGARGSDGLVAGDGVRCAAGPGNGVFVLRPPASPGGSEYCPSEPTLVEIGSDGGVRRTDLLPGCVLPGLLAVKADGAILVNEPCCRTLAGLRLDVSPPVLRSATTDPAVYTNGSVRVQADASDDASGVRGIETSLAGSPFVNTATVNLMGRAEGPHSILVRVRDGAGFVSNVLSTGVILDRTKPRTTATRVRATVPKRWRRALRKRPRTYVRGIRPQFTVRAVDSLSGVASVSLAIRHRDPRGRCAWFDFVRRDFRKLERGKANCERQLFFPSEPSGKTYSYTVERALKRTGRYTVYARTEDHARNRESTFVRGTNQLEFKIIDSKKLRGR